jgi:hypothetical protein
MITEFYRCYDSGCDDPVQDEFLEADRVFLDDPGSNFVLDEGDTPTWTVEYTTPEQDDFYGAVSYVYDTDTGEKVSDAPTFEFTVGNPESPDSGDDSTDDSTDDGSDDSTDTTQEPDLVMTSTPSVLLPDSGTNLEGSLTIKNQGGDMSENYIVEMQVRPEGEGPLSFVSSTTDTCDPDYPGNVHKEFRLDSGDEREITLSTGDIFEIGQSYEIYFLTRDQCAPNNERVEPIPYSYKWGGGAITFESDSTDDSTDDGSDDETDGALDSPQIVEVGQPELSYESSTGTVTTSFTFENEGGADMRSENIVEMQIRPKGEGVLSFSDTTNTCSSQYPENVHKSFQLDAGEKASTSLSSTLSLEPGDYDVYLVTRTECYPNDEAEPYGYGDEELVGTLTVSESPENGTGETPGFVEPPSQSIPFTAIGLGLLFTGLLAAGVLFIG